MKETKQFQAETKRLLDLVINSIYTNKEIFLRELISNASDALDKLRIQRLTNPQVNGNDDDYEPEIYLKLDKQNKTFTIVDNGIGMSRDDVINNIGTIAKSGTKDFIDKLVENNDDALNQELIGKFGIGFYSVFIVADKVELTTRKVGSAVNQAVKWVSTGVGEYDIEDCEKEKNGTEIVLYLKENCSNREFNLLSPSKIKRLVKKYSDFIKYPIKMDIEVKDKETNESKIEVQTLNSMKSLWSRNKSEITEEEYNDFFTNQFVDSSEPLDILHIKAEGTIEYTALLCIPKKAPQNLYISNYEAGLQLYSRNVLIMNKCKEFLPEYLYFVQGLVDSSDLSLNVSRELLQQSSDIRTIRKSLEKNILKRLYKIQADDREKYEQFWKEFGRSIKIGIYNGNYDFQLQNRIKDLLLFTTSYNGKLSTFAEYVSRMPEDQKQIYYVTGNSIDLIEKLPQMELLQERNMEVIYLTDPIDEFVVTILNSYNDKPFQLITSEKFHLDDAEAVQTQKQLEEIAKEHQEMLKAMQEVLGDPVKEVRLTSKLKSNAVCLSTGEGGPSLSMEKTFEMMNAPTIKAIQILELNPNHEVFSNLEKAYNLGTDSPEFKELSIALYGLALLGEGLIPPNSLNLVSIMTKYLAK